MRKSLIGLINRYTKKKYDSLRKRKKEELSAIKRFERLVYQMVQVSPSKRGTTAELLTELEIIRGRL